MKEGYVFISLHEMIMFPSIDRKEDSYTVVSKVCHNSARPVLWSPGQTLAVEKEERELFDFCVSNESCALARPEL